ncbi:hypothetical protein [Nocardia sp. NPDC004604]|uniref:hypothetical protein n=1 Tax=Nocardia sp. NPDC004604 TaxID=3157013 RepID=UPI0033A96760
MFDLSGEEAQICRLLGSPPPRGRFQVVSASVQLGNQPPDIERFVRSGEKEADFRH